MPPVRQFVQRAIINRGLPFSPLVITPQELAQRLEIGDPFYHEILARGKVLYARS